MNAGILTVGHAPPPMPLGLLGDPGRRPVIYSSPPIHPEAVRWADSVAANRGSVSSFTLSAVSDFCNAIDAAGIRDRFFRLNLFCGNQLAACLVPLYRSRSANAAPLGGFSDANNNFVAADYAETGSTGGLLGNTTTKFLETGLPMSVLVDSFPSVHMACYANNRHTGGAFVYMGTGANTQDFTLLFFDSGTTARSSAPGFRFAAVSDSMAARLGSRVISRAASNLETLFRNGTSGGTSTAAASVSDWTAWRTRPVRLFASRIQDNGASDFANLRACSYSLGLGLTSAQSLAYHNALQAFQVALGRQA